MADYTFPPKSIAPLLDLANTIYANASILTHHRLGQVEAPAALNGTNGHTPKEAAPTGPPPQNIIDATFNLLQAASDITILTAGPTNYLKSLSYSYHDITAISVILEFKVAQNVPTKPESSIAILDLAQKVGILPNRLERILRLLFLKRIFYEPTPGSVAHTPTSLILSNNPELAAFIRHCTHEAFPSASRLVDALRLYPDTEKPNQAAFNVAFATEDPLFNWFVKRPDRFENFNEGMKGISQGGGRSGDQVVGGYDWASLGKATVVDVGGGNGHISIALANAYPQLDFVVQDLGAAVAAGAEQLPTSLKDRIKFEEHDMFSPQRVADAGVYYLRHILHDWPDEFATKIIANLVPALKDGSKVLISDSVIPPPGQLHGADEKFVRYLDMQMLVLHNARERTEEDFANILKAADHRLTLVKVWKKGESVAASTLIEALFVDKSTE